MVEQASYHPEQKVPPSRAERIDTLSEQIEELEEKIASLNAKNKESGILSEEIGRLEETLRITTQEFDALCAAEEAEFNAPAPAPALVRANIPAKLQTEPSADPTQISGNVKKSPHFTVEDMKIAMGRERGEKPKGKKMKSGKENDGTGRTFASNEGYTDKEEESTITNEKTESTF